jgi:hypothetical protein
MARTTVDEVEAIIEVDSAIVLTPFIAAANALVTQCCTGLDEEYTDEQLTLIETWLSAHFYSTRDRRAKEERAGTVSATYESSVAIGFNNSQHGQTAMRLDWQGGLANLDIQVRKGTLPAPSITYLGKDRADIESE